MGANLANFHPSLAGLAVLFSRQLPNGSHDFFQTSSIYFLNHFIKDPQTTIALPFSTHNISAIGSVTPNVFHLPASLESIWKQHFLRFLTRCQVRKAQAKCFELLYFLFRFIHREEQTTFFTKSLKVIFIHKFKMVREDKATWKANYFTKIVELLDEYPKCFLVSKAYICDKMI